MNDNVVISAGIGVCKILWVGLLMQEMQTLLNLCLEADPPLFVGMECGVVVWSCRTFLSHFGSVKEKVHLIFLLTPFNVPNPQNNFSIEIVESDMIYVSFSAKHGKILGSREFSTVLSSVTATVGTSTFFVRWGRRGPPPIFNPLAPALFKKNAKSHRRYEFSHYWSWSQCAETLKYKTVQTKPQVLNSGGRKNQNWIDRQFFGRHFAQIKKEIFY